jgi:hypothetical protein
MCSTMDESIFSILEFQNNLPDYVVYIHLPFLSHGFSLFFKILESSLVSMAETL